MPQYLTPGVYVEEIAGPRSIEGVGTSTAAFVGPTRFGPTSGRPELLTSYLDFTRVFGDAVGLSFVRAGAPNRDPANLNPAVVNHVALGVKGFFDEGGTALYVTRTFSYFATGTPLDDHANFQLPQSGTPAEPRLTLRARFPGLAGRMRVTLSLRAGNNALVTSGGTKTLTRVQSWDTVYAVAGATEGVYAVTRDATTGAWQFVGNHATAMTLAAATAVYPITVAVDVQQPTVDGQGLATFGPPTTIGEFGFDPRSAGGGITGVLTADPVNRVQALTIPLAVEGVPTTPTNDSATAVAVGLLGTAVLATAKTGATTGQSVTVVLGGGSDGFVPAVSHYEGSESPQRGLKGLEALEDISIVAAPGATSGWVAAGDPALAQAVNNAVATHCENMRYRVAALDTPPQRTTGQALDFRNLRSSTHAALYYPWIITSHPLDGSRVAAPPAAYLAGVWARTDATRGVIKAPANEVVRSALDLEVRLNKAQQGLLNPEGVDCLRYFPGSGFLVWGARTISDDPEWKYLSIRRYFNYLEKSIDEGTQWVVFEINGPELWQAVTSTVEGFLLNEWKSGALLGSKPEEGYFVRCDASTMTQNDLDNGRLVCQIGVAAAKPAEFVIFRISQWTATATS